MRKLERTRVVPAKCIGRWGRRRHARDPTRLRPQPGREAFSPVTPFAETGLFFCFHVQKKKLAKQAKPSYSLGMKSVAIRFTGEQAIERFAAAFGAKTGGFRSVAVIKREVIDMVCESGVATFDGGDAELAHAAALESEGCFIK